MQSKVPKWNNTIVPSYRGIRNLNGLKSPFFLIYCLTFSEMILLGLNKVLSAKTYLVI
nr:hypothetical protein [Elizabethkingia sp. ASV34]